MEDTQFPEVFFIIMMFWALLFIYWYKYTVVKLIAIQRSQKRQVATEINCF
jgi:hypothetical protein